MPAASAPDWFFTTGPVGTTVGERRQQAERDASLSALAQIFPAAPDTVLREAVDAGGNLSLIIDRLLAQQLAEEMRLDDVAASSTSGASASGPRRRVRFGQNKSFDAPEPYPIEQMQPMVYEAPVPFGNAGTAIGGGGSNDGASSSGGANSDGGAGSSGGAGSGGGASEGMCRLSDEELNESLASSGITAEPSPGSARNLSLAALSSASDASALDAILRDGGLEALRDQPISQLATGALALSARVVQTSNALEGGLLGTEKIVTYFVVEVRQLGIRWEVSRRYSQFYSFHELLCLHWYDLPTLPPKLIFSQEVTDIAQRMDDLDVYLKALLASPAVALSPLVCAFLDAIDVTSFRHSMLPRLVQQSNSDPTEPPQRVSLTMLEASDAPML